MTKTDLTLNENTKIPIFIGVSAVLLAVPLTLYFASTRAIAESASAENVKQDIAVIVLQKDLSDIKADIREIKTVLKLKKGARGE